MMPSGNRTANRDEKPKCLIAFRINKVRDDSELSENPIIEPRPHVNLNDARRQDGTFPDTHLLDPIDSAQNTDVHASNEDMVKATSTSKLTLRKNPTPEDRKRTYDFLRGFIK